MQISHNYFIINIYKVLNILPLFLLSITSSGFAQISSNQAAKITFHDETRKKAVEGYIITQLQDETGNSVVGKLVSVVKQAYSITLDNGIGTSVQKYISHNYTFINPDKKIQITIKKLNLDETLATPQGVNGKLSIQVSFDIDKGDELYSHLIEYKGAISYTRGVTQTFNAEQYLRDGLKNSLKFFDEWFNKYKRSNPLLANSVKLIFDDYKESLEGDTIYYSPKRQLSWADFKDRAHNGIYAAEVIPGLGFTESNVLKNGVVIVEIKLKVFLPKSAAWVKPGEENEINLNHEQRHFDIVRIVAERFKKKLLAEKLPVYNYDGYINVDYFDALREITALQKQYDHETIHGSNFAEQQRWNRKIDAELAGVVSGS